MFNTKSYGNIQTFLTPPLINIIIGNMELWDIVKMALMMKHWC